MSGITLSTRPKPPVIFNSDRFKGLSAYEVAVANGFEGTVEEWLLSLVGAEGDSGDQIELQMSGDVLQWRYVGEAEWVSLYDFAAIFGDIESSLDAIVVIQNEILGI